jgi:TonB-linked SusC/RagA family outer membrane protein
VNPQYRSRFVYALLLLAVVAPPLVAQRGQIAGTVSDSSSGGPVIGAQVTVGGTTLGAVTNEEGRFTVVGVSPGTHTIDARRLGFAPRTIRGVQVTAGQTTTVDIQLSPVAFRLQEQVTTGVVDPTSGTRTPFTVGRVTAEDAPVPATNPLQTIQGKIAGATVVNRGQPGTGTDIILRAPTSITKSNAPLIVVDGVILSRTFGASSADLESLDIESIEVIKGAAASSLYGSRASSGVISIRTKRGSELRDGETRITLRSEVGAAQLPNKVEWSRYHHYMLNAQGQYINAAGTVVPRHQRVADSAYRMFQDNPFPDPTYDQVEEFFDPSDFYTNSVTLAQNTTKTNFLTTVANHKTGGVVVGHEGYRRNDLRLNLDHRMRDNLSASVSVYHMRSTRDDLPEDTFFALVHLAPDINLRTPDPDGTPFAFQPGNDPNTDRRENPLYLVATEQETSKRARTLGSADVRFSPLSWLRLEANASYDRSDREYRFFLDRGLKSEGFPQGDPGFIERTSGTTNALNASASANLLNQFGNLTARATFRGIMEREENDFFEAEGNTLRAGQVPDLSAAQFYQSASTFEDIRSNAYFAVVGLDYDGRYIADGLVRRDGSSLFGPDERWHTYYRVSGAWRMAQESWWRFPQISEFKLRFSRGTAGGRPSFADQYETFTFAGTGALVKASLGNTALKPERATENEFGIDAIVMNRVSVQLSHSRTKVEDQLLQIPLVGAFGFESQWQNAGTVEGRSWEATMEARLFESPTMSWKMGLVADRSRHKVTEFNRPCYFTSVISYRCAGETLGSIYGSHFLRNPSELPTAHAGSRDAFEVNDEGLLVPVGAANNYTEGVSKRLWGTTVTIDGINYPWGIPIRLKDAEGADSIVRIGESQPDYRLGLSNNFSWKGLQVYGLFDMWVGGNVYNSLKQRLYQWYRSAEEDQVGKPEELKKPVRYYDELYNGNNENDWFVEDGGFLKLRELSVKYRFGPQQLGPLSRLGTRGISIGLIGRNLFTITDYTGYDPEILDEDNATVRREGFVYPNFRTFTGTIEIEF